MITSDLKKILPGEQIQEEGENPLYKDAVYTVFPKTEEEIAGILQYANQNGLKVIPVSGGTKSGLGGIDEKANIRLSLSAFTGIVEHSVGDMTVTVRSGTTMKEVTEYLAQYQQMFPIDPAHPEFSTVGGVIAANDSGPKRLRYGSARDHVIGLRVVYPDGRIIRTGGKVVKNVAGYDMSKLFIGSMGTLGIMTEITMKLRPLPKYESLVLLRFSKGDMNEFKTFIIALLDSMIEPVSLEIISPTLNKRLTGEGGYSLAIAFEDVERSVLYQEDWVRSRKPEGTEMQILHQDQAKSWWSAFYAIAPYGSHAETTTEMEVALKIGSLNMDVPEIISACEEMGGSKNLHVETHGGAGHGISRAYIKGNEDHILSFIQLIRLFVEESGGYVIVQHAPLPLRNRLSVWSEKPSCFSLMEGIKRSIDPNRVLNPNRFVGGI